MLERLARPLAGFGNGLATITNAVYRGMGAPGKLLQDFLNGAWLGHTVHAVVVDVVIGAATAAVLLDVLRVVFGVEGLETATTWTLGLAAVAGLSAILTGLTDFKDTATGDERNITVLHGLINIVAVVVFAVSLFQRLGGGYDAAFWTLLIGYLVISFGSYIGGHVVFKYGYMVNRNAFARGKKAAEYTAVMSAEGLADDTPTAASYGATKLVVVKRGDVVFALKETCSHAGGPLAEGKVRGDNIECPWHFSQFRLSDGAVRHGPAATKQVAYRARIAGGQVEIQGPIE
ncbi:MAG TPA: Rieske 2Fe-2S domain-containing protein [Candidatus Limnocylindria bacterium]|nr:Rieske 2Fe-2S domain-containing protein [Candidatus Limnocylindria bacterium]